MTKATNPRKSTVMPVTTMEEVPVLSDEEKEELLASLQQAQTEIAAGDYLEFKQGKLGHGCASSKRKRAAENRSMAYKVRFSAQSRLAIRNLFDYLAGYGGDVAKSYVSELELAVERHIATRPLTWQFFSLTRTFPRVPV